MRFVTPFVASRGLASELWRDMDKMFNDFTVALPTTEESYAVASEVVEADEHFILSLDMPGLKKEDIKIELHGNTLTVSGERKRERENTDQTQNVIRAEKFFGAFKRSYTLPVSIEDTKIVAHYKDGVLEVFLPKAQSAQPRKIEVQSGKT